MTEDHETKLEALGAKLADVFIDEADPDNWPGAGKKPSEHGKDERGDRAWSLKGANQLGLLLARTLELRMRVKWARTQAAGGAVPIEASEGRVSDPEDDIRRLEREAQRVMEKALGTARGR